MNTLNSVLLVLFIGHIITTVIIVLALLCSIRSDTVAQPGLSVRLRSLLAISSSLMWIIGSSIITIVFGSAVGEINKIGNKFGLFAEKGIKFYALIWSTAGCMACVCIIWCGEWWQERHRGRAYLQEGKSGS